MKKTNKKIQLEKDIKNNISKNCFVKNNFLEMIAKKSRENEKTKRVLNKFAGNF